MCPTTIKLAKVLRMSPEELVEKYKINKLNLGQIVTIANFMRLTSEQTIRKFFPGFLYGYRRLAFRKEVANAESKDREKAWRGCPAVHRNRESEEESKAKCYSKVSLRIRKDNQCS